MKTYQKQTKTKNPKIKTLAKHVISLSALVGKPQIVKMTEAFWVIGDISASDS